MSEHNDTNLESCLANRHVVEGRRIHLKGREIKKREPWEHVEIETVSLRCRTHTVHWSSLTRRSCTLQHPSVCHRSVCTPSDARRSYHGSGAVKQPRPRGTSHSSRAQAPEAVLANLQEEIHGTADTVHRQCLKQELEELGRLRSHHHGVANEVARLTRSSVCQCSRRGIQGFRRCVGVLRGHVTPHETFTTSWRS